MSNIVNNVKNKLAGNKGSTETQASSQGNQEQTYSIQPHPAKTNDPADLQPSGPGSGLRHGGPMEAFHARDPYVPSEQIRNNLPEPATQEEMKARTNELNQK